MTIKLVKDYRYDEGITPIVSKRAPTTRDFKTGNGKTEIGTIWIDTVNNDVYVLTSVVDNSATWVGAGGGAETLSSLTVTPGNTTLTGGNLALSAGTITASALGAGVVQTSGTGVFTSNKGTNGTLLIGSTAGVPAWASLASSDGSIVITPGANSIDLAATGGTSSTFVTTSGGPVSPLAGALNVIGYNSNITTDGATANTVKVRLADSVSVSGALTAGVNLNMTAGVATITSTVNAASSIYLHANAGTSETINIHSDQGTGVASINMHSDVGGLTLDSGLASADAINITASNAAGGIDIDAGTAGINVTATNGAISLISGTGAVNIGADGAAHVVTVGSTTTTASTIIQSGSTGLTANSLGVLDVDAVGAVSINSSTDVINIGNDAISQNMSIGTAGARIITIGNSTGATSVVVNSGTGNLDLGVNATDHTTRLGSTNGVSATTVQTGTGTLTLNSGGIIATTSTGATTIDAAGNVEINSSAGTIDIGQDNVSQAINIGIAGTRTLTMGSAAATSSVVINTGTGNLDLGVNATDHSTRLGSTNGVSATTIQSGTGALVVNGGGALTLDAAGVLELNSSAAAISIGNDNVSQAVNISTAGTRTLTMGSAAATSSVVVNGGTGVMQFGANATEHATTIGSITTASATTIQGGTGGIALNAAGIVSVAPATNSAAGVAVTLNARVGQAVFTGQTTAAAASQEFTINNTSIAAATTAILVTAANLGANDAQMTVTRVVPATNSVVVTLTNNGAAALNGDVQITFWVLN